MYLFKISQYTLCSEVSYFFRPVATIVNRFSNSNMVHIKKSKSCIDELYGTDGASTLKFQVSRSAIMKNSDSKQQLKTAKSFQSKITRNVSLLYCTIQISAICSIQDLLDV